MNVIYQLRLYSPVLSFILGLFGGMESPGFQVLVEPERSSTICRRNIGLIDAGPLLKRTAVEHRKVL